MGPELSFWTLETSSKGFKTLRIFLDRSRPLNSTFLMPKNEQQIGKSPNVGEQIEWPVNRNVELGLRGPMGLHGGPPGWSPGVCPIIALFPGLGVPYYGFQGLLG